MVTFSLFSRFSLHFSDPMSNAFPIPNRAEARGPAKRRDACSAVSPRLSSPLFAPTFPVPRKGPPMTRHSRRSFLKLLGKEDGSRLDGSSGLALCGEAYSALAKAHGG